MFGINQPENGMFRPLPFPAMPKGTKGPAPDELVRLRTAVASNLRAYMTVRYGSQTAETAAAEEIGRATGLGKNTVLRALGKGNDDTDLRLDTLVRLAQHFNATASDLLRDYGHSFRMNDKNNKARPEGPESEGERASLHRHRRA